MRFFLKVAAVLAMSVLTPAAAPAYGGEQASPTDTARFLAGMHPSPQSPLAPLTQERGWQQHADTLNAIWAGLDAQQLSKIRAWSRANLKDRKPVTYYPFSGPDFLYADAFFPDASTYILAGLEPAGQIPDVLKLRPRSVATDLAKLRTSLGTLLKMSYFITSEMGADLSASELRGTLPLLYVFLARTGKTIHEVSLVDLAPDGSLQSAAIPRAAHAGSRSSSRATTPGRGRSTTSGPTSAIAASRAAASCSSARSSASAMFSSRLPPTFFTTPDFRPSATSCSATAPRWCRTIPACLRNISSRQDGIFGRSAGM